jgi:hypothetical protein
MTDSSQSSAATLAEVNSRARLSKIWWPERPSEGIAEESRQGRAPTRRAHVSESHQRSRDASRLQRRPITGGGIAQEVGHRPLAALHHCPSGILRAQRAGGMVRMPGFRGDQGMRCGCFARRQQQVIAKRGGAERWISPDQRRSGFPSTVEPVEILLPTSRFLNSLFAVY